jgi:cytochrome c-type biogenesis protein CcmH/NrfG
VAVVACVVNLLLLCKYKKVRMNEKPGYSHDPDTTASY